MQDSEFIRGDVPMTKQEVRCLTIERLALENASHFIDVGAGTGSIAIEAALRYPQLQVLAIERNPHAVELIGRNVAKFNVTNLQIRHDYAPVVLPDWRADAIFIGGSGGNLCDIIDWSHQLLKPGGRLVLNFILLNNLTEALAHLNNSNFNALEVCQLNVAYLTRLGPGEFFKPNNPTYIISCQKPKECPDVEHN